MAKPAAILDIGSSKIVCIVGSPSGRDGVAVHGIAVRPFFGYKDGEILDEQAFGYEIAEAVRLAEEESRTRIREMAVCVPGPFSLLLSAEAAVPVKSRSKKVSANDIDELINASLRGEKAPGYVLMHSTPVSYRLDGAAVYEVPEGEKAGELGGFISHMYAGESFVKTVEDALSAIGVETLMCFSGALSEALFVIPEKARVRPAALIDVGYTHTDVALVEGAALTGLTSIPVGGYHFAHDLSFGLDIALEAAEQMKRRFVFDQEPLSRTQVVRTSTGPKRVEHSVIRLIMEARANDLTALIAQALRDMGAGELPLTAYLTGGGLTMIKGGAERLKSALQLPVKKDAPNAPSLDTPNYTSVFAALDFVLRAVGEEYEDELIEESPLDKIREFFKK